MRTKIRSSHSDQAVTIAEAQEALWCAVMGGIEQGMTPQEVIAAQQKAPSVKREMERLKKRQARELMAVQAQNMGGFGGGGPFMRPLLGGDYMTDDFSNGGE